MSRFTTNTVHQILRPCAANVLNYPRLQGSCQTQKKCRWISMRLSNVRRNNPYSGKSVKSMSRASLRSFLSWTSSRGFKSFRPKSIDQSSDGTVQVSRFLHAHPHSPFIYSWFPGVFPPSLSKTSQIPTSCLHYRGNPTAQSQRYTMARLRLLSVASNIRCLVQRPPYINTLGLNMHQCPVASVSQSFSGRIHPLLSHQSMGKSFLLIHSAHDAQSLPQSYLSAAQKRKER